MRNFLGLGFLGACASLGVAACCVLPMLLMLGGVGSAWVAVFVQIASVAYHVIAASLGVVALGWFVAWRRGLVPRLGKWLTGSTALVLLALAVAANETRINDFLIRLM